MLYDAEGDGWEAGHRYHIATDEKETVFSGRLEAGGMEIRWICLDDGNYYLAANLTLAIESVDLRGARNSEGMELVSTGRIGFSVSKGGVFGHPSPAPTMSQVPSSVPTPIPSPSPDFFLYYTTGDEDLYEYSTATGSNPVTSGDLAGDVKVDSRNRLLFYTSPTDGRVTKYDLVDGETSLLYWRLGTKPLGLAYDDVHNYLYFADQAHQALKRVDYDGDKTIVVRNMTAEGIFPIGLDISPNLVLENFNEGEPGVIFMTGYDDMNGYIMQIDLSGSTSRTIYTSSAQDIYGIAIDVDESSMWWIEDRGIANGLYSSKYTYTSSLDNDVSAYFVAELENSMWLASLWEESLIYSCDGDKSTIVKVTVVRSELKQRSVQGILTSDSPRGVALYYGPPFSWSNS